MVPAHRLPHTLRVLVTLACMVVLGCGPREAPPRPEASPPPPSREERIFYLGRIPFLTATEVVKRIDPLLDDLARRLGYDRVVMVLAPNYQGVLDLLLDGKVDAAWFGTEAYMDARRRKLPIEALVVPSRRGRTWYEGNVIARSDSGLLAVSDLKGKKVAFVDPKSSSGWAAPRRLLEDAGVRVPADLLTRRPGEADFLSKHDNVVHAVYFGSFDAGAVYAGAIEDTFERDQAKILEMVVLARTGRIPNEPIVVPVNLPEERKVRVRDAFLGLDLSGDKEQVFGGVERFVPVTPDLFREPAPATNSP